MTKILLVEDDLALREIYAVRLRAENYEIVVANDGEQALLVAAKEKPDLIISDIMMPKISGFEMLDLLRSNPITQNIRVIMMTALGGERERQRGEALGADRYLVKSQVGIEDVVHTVHEVLGDQITAPAPAAPAPMQSPINPPQATTPSAFQYSPMPAPPAQPVSQPQPVAAPVSQPVAQVTQPTQQTPTQPDPDATWQTKSAFPNVANAPQPIFAQIEGLEMDPPNVQQQTTFAAQAPNTPPVAPAPQQPIQPVAPPQPIAPTQPPQFPDQQP